MTPKRQSLSAIGRATLTTLTIGGALASSAWAQNPAAELAACRASFQTVSGDPASIACDWRTVMRAAPGAALLGRYVGTFKGFHADLAILDGSTAPALVGISSVNKRTTHTCTVMATGARGSNDTLTVRDASAPNCTISIVSSGKNRIRVTSTAPCRDLCGVSGMFDGTYRVRR